MVFIFIFYNFHKQKDHRFLGGRGRDDISDTRKIEAVANNFSSVELTQGAVQPRVVGFEEAWHNDISGSILYLKNCTKKDHRFLGGRGRDDRIRTCGILVPNQALYQTEPHPVAFSQVLNYYTTQYGNCQHFFESFFEILYFFDEIVNLPLSFQYYYLITVLFAHILVGFLLLPCASVC